MKGLVWLSLLIISLSLVLGAAADDQQRIRCASTTSTQNSGFFDYILPIFEKETGIKVDVLAVGTGAALEIGQRGDADVVFCHSKDDELRLVKAGYFVERHDVMYNDFIIVGPAQDPAGVRGLKSARAAFKRLGAGKAPFVSRGDDSGTHKKELQLWKQAGITPKGAAWYLEVGQGMAKTLRIAGEKRAYTLTDRATWLALQDKEQLGLTVLVEGDEALFNQYGVMVVNPKRFPQVKYDAAMQFVRFLISPRGQQAIAAFKDAAGNQLFHANAK